MKGFDGAELLSKVRAKDIFSKVFEDLPNTLFWIKDTELRLCYVNQTFATWVNLSPSEIIGRTDADLYFTDLARVFTADDRSVMETGKEIRDKEELCATRFGSVEWRIVSKFPLYDDEGNIIGTTGASRQLSTKRMQELPEQYHDFTRIVDYARSHIHEGVTVQDIADFSHMTLSTLERRFRKYLGITPREFLQDLRLSLATELLRDTTLSVSEIAEQLGYESVATFSRAFRQLTDSTPSLFRKERTPPASK